MKKRDFLFLGLILAAVPVGAQRPAETPQDAKVIFTQNFEPKDESMTADEAWEAWQAEVIDTIKELKFYKKASAGNINPSADINIYDGSEDWKIGYIRTDSISADAQPGEGILLKNGVVITDANVADWPEDQARIVTDESVERADAFSKYGEDGGKYIFRYISGKPTIASSQYGEYYQNVSAAYRRNLFVRGLDIEDNTSYRVTLFIKAKPLGTTSPKFYLNVMRGYFNSECDFSMGYVDNNNDNHPLEYSTAFSLTKEDFNGKWEKVTFMTHYLNDSISNAYIFTKNGYWWSGRWWATDAEGKTYDYIQQPDKFFLRLSFASDSTTFDVDNIAITKSTIGGIEHEGTMIRVNFGYDTNLKDLANAAFKKTGVAAIELPGQYFTVAGKSKRNGQWTNIEINSAEYHDDGYMYMWSKDSEYQGSFFENPFTAYDSVYVSFTNPDVDELCLKYSGDRFPYALDTAWIVAGKKLRGFSNEMSVPNPNIVVNQYGKRVYSMKALPPVLTEVEYEKGSFNLPGNITSMKFKFSRKVQFEQNATFQTEQAMLKVMKGGVTEYWFASSETGDADSTLTFTRQAVDINKGVLDGNYVFELCGIQGIGTDFAENELIDYSFGSSDVEPETIAGVTFENESQDDLVKKYGDFDTDRAYLFVGQFGGLYEKAILFGIFGKGDTNAEAGANCPKLFYSVEFASAGTYGIEVATSGLDYMGTHQKKARLDVKMLDAEGNSVGGLEDLPCADDNISVPGNDITGVDRASFNVSIKTPGTYKLAFTLPNEAAYGGWSKIGRALYEIKITSESLLGWPYISKLRSALEGLNNKIAAAEEDEDKYTGAAYDASQEIAEFYADFTDTKPSRYNTVIDSINKATDALKARFDLIAALDKQYDIANDTLAAYEGGREDLMDLVAYGDLEELADEVFELVYSGMTDDSVKAYTKMIEDAIKALNNRIDLIAAFNKQLAATNASIEKAKFADIDQYAAMVRTYNAYKSFNVVAATDDELKDATNAVLAGTLPYDSYVAGVESTTARIKNLAALAEELEVEIVDEETTEAFNDRAAKTLFDDVALAELYKSAIRVAILTQLSEGDLEDEIDLTGFIRNFNLYTAGSVKSNDNPEGELEKYYYQWGQPNDRWRLISNTKFENAFPGWVISTAGGNVHLGSETTNWSEPKAPTFDAFIAADWSSAVTMTQVVTDLPAGKYTLGVALTYNEANQGAPGQKIQLVQLGDSLVTWEVGGSTSDQVATETTVAIEGLEVNADTLDIHYATPSFNTWVRVDNWSLTLTDKLDGYDYDAALAAEKIRLNELLTFVENAGEAVSVSYYGIDGVQIDAPKAGSVTIKVTEFADGKRLVEKILVK